MNIFNGQTILNIIIMIILSLLTMITYSHQQIIDGLVENQVGIVDNISGILDIIKEIK